MYSRGMEIMEIPIINRRTLRRPSVSDIHPDRIRPEALPAAPTTNPMVAKAALEMCTLLANGTNWLITIRPADVPNAYAIHMK